MVENIPKHVTVIMDGNRRWAKKRGLPVVAGHKKVVEERIEELIEKAAEMGVEYITFWAFSTENWGRAKKEVGGIMKLFRWALEKKAKSLIEKGARVKMIGDLKAFDEDIREGFEKLMKQSEKNTKIVVTFALNYGGRDEVIRAIRKILMNEIPDRLVHHIYQTVEDDKAVLKSLTALSDEVDDEMLSSYLDTRDMPDPDLIIRTSGEQRLSGFMPWQGVYAELYFPEILMPDFDEKEFEKAMNEYGRRKRRFGKG